MNKSLLLILCACISLSALAQKTINGITLPAKLKMGTTELVLNGGGIRKKAFFKLYTAGLYLTARNTNAADLVSSDKPAYIRLTITSSVISSDNMSEAIHDGFEKSMKGNTASQKANIETFVSTFKKEEIKEGDLFELYYEPGVGVKAFKNGKLQNTIPGLDFKKALLGIWLGEDPVDADLKAAFLAG